MKVHLLIQREPGSNEMTYWVDDAVDEWTLDEWQGVYPDVIRVKLDGDPENRRILIVEVPDDAMERPFDVPTVTGSIVNE